MNQKREWRWLLRWEMLLAVILVMVTVANIRMSEHYLGVDNFVNLFQLSVEKIILALITAFVIINAEIDLSIASLMGLSACLFAWLYNKDVPAELAIVIALAVGGHQRRFQRLLGSLRGAAVAGRDARRAGHVSRRGAHLAGRSIRRPLPRVVQ